jgi:hypothetical protein
LALGERIVSVRLSPRLQNKVALMAEDFPASIPLALRLKDGRRIRRVVVSRDSVIERVDGRDVAYEKDLGFLCSDIQDVDFDIDR